MRLTIADLRRRIVLDVYQSNDAIDVLRALSVHLGRYPATDDELTWFVTPFDVMPGHAQHDRWGLIWESHGCPTN